MVYQVNPDNYKTSSKDDFTNVSADKMLSAYKECNYDEINYKVFNTLLGYGHSSNLIILFAKYGYSYSLYCSCIQNMLSFLTVHPNYYDSLFKNDVIEYIEKCAEYKYDIEWDTVFSTLLIERVRLDVNVNEQLIKYVNLALRLGCKIDPAIATAYDIPLEYCQ